MKKKMYLLAVILLGSMASFGQTWSNLSSGISGTVNAMTAYNNSLYVGGQFNSAGGASANNIAKWDGFGWSNVSTGANSNIYCFSIYNSNLIAGGAFTTAGGTTSNYISKWTGSAWQNLGYGFNSDVQCLSTFNGDLIAGGLFTQADSNSAYHIAKWNGSNWTTLGTGTDDVVKVLCKYNNELYAGGGFTMAGGTTVPHIAKWNGTSWNSVGAITGTINSITAMDSLNGSLYVCGNFSDGSNPQSLLKYNGSTWNYVSIPFVPNSGNSIRWWIGSQKVLNGKLYFAASDGSGHVFILTYDGSSWGQIGGSSGSQFGGSSNYLNNSVYALEIFNNALYVGGYFNSAGTTTAYRVAYWTEYPNAIFNSSTDTICPNGSVTFTDNSTGPVFSRVWSFPGGIPSASTVINPTVTYSSAGSYTVTLIVSNPSGKDTVMSNDFITVNPLPAKPIISQEKFVLASNAGSGNQWYHNDTLITGATKQLYVVHAPIKVKQCYSVISMNNFGCYAKSDTVCYEINQGNDTCFLYDTVKVKINIYDTIHVTVKDTVHVIVYDTIKVKINIYDTIHITVHDTVKVKVNVYDSIHVTIKDTIHYTVYDTVHVAVMDTLIVHTVITGLNPPDNINTIKVYPNPAKDFVIINTGNYSLMSNYKIRIENTLGQMVFDSFISQQQFQLDVKSFGGYGTYFVKVIDNKGVVIDTRKLILQK